MLGSLHIRLRQTTRLLTSSKVAPGVRADAMELLTAAQREAFATLSRFDQEHLLCVYQTLNAAGHADTDLLAAGLMHDIGKHHGGQHARFVDRAVRVVLARFAPGVLKVLARPPAGGWRSGLVVAVHHAEFGANQIATFGFNERVCWLVREHESAAGSHDSATLSALQQADRAC